MDVTEADTAQLAEADALIHEGKTLRKRVFSRIRQRRWRKRKQTND